MTEVILTPDLTAIAQRWEDRAQTYGARCVINLAHPEENFSAVTAAQSEVFFRHLRPLLTGKERTALDFGCGVGRFSAELAKTISGIVTAYDPCETLINTGRAFCTNASVVFMTGPTDAFLRRRLLTNSAFDVLFITNVLGGLPDSALPALAASLQTLMSPNGLLFLVEHVDENEAPSQEKDFWTFREAEFYEKLFSRVALQRLGMHRERQHPLMIFGGRLRA